MAVAMDDTDLSVVDAILDARKRELGAIIPILQQTQEAYGFLPRPVLARIAETLGVPFTQLYGVATFYSQFYLSRRGRNIIKVCDGTACHVKGASRTLELLEEELGTRAGETTEDYEYTWEVVYCLGACALAPVAVVNADVKGHCTSERMLQTLLTMRQ